jgi:hypothetical protein
VDLVESSDRGEAELVDSRVGRVRCGTDTLGRVGHELAHDVVLDVSRLLLSPERHGIRPALSHTASLSGLEAASGATTYVS